MTATLMLVFIIAIIWHELGHLAATEYLGTTESFVFYYRQGWMKWLVWGVAVRHDGSTLSQNQRLLAALAPLAWLLPAYPLLAWTANPAVNGAGLVLFFAAVMTLVSDIPHQLLGWGSTDGFETYELINFRSEHA